MAYEFKKLSEVDVVESPSDAAHVLIEENGTVKKVVKNAVGETSEVILGKLAAVDSTETPAETANVLIEEDGVVKKVAKTAVGETAEAILGKIAAVDAANEPTENANVLIEEDGALKRVPASSISSGQADLVIRMNQHPTNATVNNIEIISGSVEAVYDMFENGTIPKVDVEVYVPATVNSYTRAGYKVSAQVTFYGDALFINAIAGIYGEAPDAFRITFDSRANYALVDYACRTVTTTQ